MLKWTLLISGDEGGECDRDFDVTFRRSMPSLRVAKSGIEQLPSRFQ